MSERAPADYLPRLADSQLHDMLQVSPAVVIEGPRACGKTTTASQAASSVLSMEEIEFASGAPDAMRSMLDRESPADSIGGCE